MKAKEMGSAARRGGLSSISSPAAMAPPMRASGAHGLPGSAISIPAAIDALPASRTTSRTHCLTDPPPAPRGRGGPGRPNRCRPPAVPPPSRARRPRGRRRTCSLRRSIAAMNASTQWALNWVPDAGAELGERGLLAERPPVGPGGGHGVEGVGHVDDRRLDEARSVDGGGGGLGGRVARDRSEEVDAAQQLDRHRLVALHPFELRLGQTTGLVEQLVGHHELADVVHERGVAEPLHAALAERELGTDVLGERGDALRVTGGVPVLRLERVDQRLDRLLLTRLQLEVARERRPRDQDRHDQKGNHGGAEGQVDPPETEPQEGKGKGGCVVGKAISSGHGSTPRG